MAKQPSFTFLLLFFVLLFLHQTGGSQIGINYGRLGSNLPPPETVIPLLKSLGIGLVKIFDTDPIVLRAFSNSNLKLVVAAPNEDLQILATSQSSSDQWLQQNILPFHPSAGIWIIVVGNEVLSQPENNCQQFPFLFPAMQNLQNSLVRFNLHNTIKISTSLAMDVLQSTYPPSASTFRSDISDQIMIPILSLLNSTKSYIFVNAYPYLAWSANPDRIPLNYALLDPSFPAIVDGNFRYTNLLDAQLDSFVAAMGKVGFPDVKIAISETGWPTLSEFDTVGANVANAAIYNGRVVERTVSYWPRGTPRRPRTRIPTFIFSLFNENEKPGPLTERNWGVLYPNTSIVYRVDWVGA